MVLTWHKTISVPVILQKILCFTDKRLTKEYLTKNIYRNLRVMEYAIFIYTVVIR